MVASNGCRCSWLKDLKYINCVEMAKYFSASMINNEGVFQCCFPIDCVAEGDEDHLISRVGKPQDLQVWCEQVMLV